MKFHNGSPLRDLPEWSWAHSYLQLQVNSTLEFGTKGKMPLFLAFLAFSQQGPVASSQVSKRTMTDG